MRCIDLFAVQAWVSAETYSSPAAFRAAVFDAVDRCHAVSAGDVPALIVFPENVGTFLFLATMGTLGQRLRSPTLGMGVALARNPRAFLRALRDRPKPSVAALRSVAPDVRGLYEETFSAAAARAGATVVAGSALLPDGDDGRVYNLSLSFGPQGEVLGRTRKVNLVPGLEDTLGLTPGRPEDIPVVETSVGRLATLICYDGFAVPHTDDEPHWVRAGARLGPRGAHIVAQPAANPWAWDGDWVHRRAGEPILRREQWALEGLQRELQRLEGVRYGVTAHLCGEVLGQPFEGRSAILERGTDGDVRVVAEAPRVGRTAADAAIVRARVEAPWLA